MFLFSLTTYWKNTRVSITCDANCASMKRIFLFFVVLVVFTACEKTIQKTQDELITSVITNGQWRVSNFTKGGINITNDFTDYKFQFQSNKTVDAIKNGSIQATGTWEANAVARTITSGFQSVQNPFPLLNGVWTVTNNSWTFVEATKTTANEIYTVRLDKL